MCVVCACEPVLGQDRGIRGEAFPPPPHGRARCKTRAPVACCGNAGQSPWFSASASRGAGCTSHFPGASVGTRWSPSGVQGTLGEGSKREVWTRANVSFTRWLKKKKKKHCRQLLIMNGIPCVNEVYFVFQNKVMQSAGADTTAASCCCFIITFLPLAPNDTHFLLVLQTIMYKLKNNTNLVNRVYFQMLTIKY